MKNNYYVYVYCDPRMPCDLEFMNVKFNHIPFYVGKGKGKRMFKHLYDKDKSQKSKRIEIIKDYYQLPIIFKLFENLTETQAFYIEACFIDHFDIIANGGCLLNKVKPNINKWDYRKEDFGLEKVLDLSDPTAVVKNDNVEYIVVDEESKSILSVHKTLNSLGKSVGITKSLAENLINDYYPYNRIRRKILLKKDRLIPFLSKFKSHKNF